MFNWISNRTGARWSIGAIALMFVIALSMLFAAAVGLAGTKKKRIGPELSFWSKKTLQAWKDRMAKAKQGELDEQTAQYPIADGEHLEAVALRDEILRNCPQCECLPVKGKYPYPLDAYRIDFPNGFWIVIDVDPGIVEIQTPALTYEEYERLEKFIQSEIYDRAASIELTPPNDTDGLSNFGALSTFADVKELAEFIKDQVEHPELGLGVLGEDLMNAPPLVFQDEKQIEAFYRVLKQVASGEITTHKQFAQFMNRDVYYLSLMFEGDPRKGRHHQAVGLKRLEDESFPERKDVPVEVRTTAARATFKLVLLNYRLLLKRIEFLEKRGFTAGIRRALNPYVVKDMSPSEKLSRYYIYIAEMGEDPETYRELIYDREVAQTKLDTFARASLRRSRSD